MPPGVGRRPGRGAPGGGVTGDIPVTEFRVAR